MAARKSLSFASLEAAKRDAVREARDNMAALKRNASAYRAALAALAPVTKLGACSTSTYGWKRWDDSEECHLSVSLRIDVESIKENPELIRALVAAEALPGFETRDSTDYASEWSAERSYRYRGKVAGVDVTLSVTASIKGEGATCRKVAVTKLVEQTEYQLVCD